MYERSLVYSLDLRSHSASLRYCDHGSLGAGVCSFFLNVGKSPPVFMGVFHIYQIFASKLVKTFITVVPKLTFSPSLFDPVPVVTGVV